VEFLDHHKLFAVLFKQFSSRRMRLAVSTQSSGTCHQISEKKTRKKARLTFMLILGSMVRAINIIIDASCQLQVAYRVMQISKTIKACHQSPGNIASVLIMSSAF
jgi:hypothetical protein